MAKSIVYLNGNFMPIEEANVSVLDRGFIFGDGVYEVIPVYAKRLFRLDEHLDRLSNSLDATRIPNPYSECDWKKYLSQIVMKHEEEDQSIYVQVTRGVAKRDHAFPVNMTPTVFMMSNPLQVTDVKTFNKGVSAITLDDIRWQYCNIKAITLLPNILLKQTAIDEDAQEAILVRNGEVTEGSASNIFVVIDGVIKTPPKSSRLLAGITRDLIVELANKNNIKCIESNFSQTDLSSADEIWLTSSTKEVLPIVKLNNEIIGNGKPGPISQKMYKIFQDYKTELKRNET
ncbi:D-alanine aminotransferase [hydrothermal vent metagenome]|uniref:D-alanine aminotransferase n=1 Tax=hydrothermal vent metagenome TaxID=652676 RepID=A0A3B1A2B9_9ZZZZ